MPTDHSADPWRATNYNGYSNAPPQAPQPAAVRRPSRAMLLGGVAAALALGGVLGLVASPSRLNTGAGPERAPMQAVTPPADGQVQIAVNSPPQPQPVGGKLNVLPGQSARAAAPAPPAPVVSTPPQPTVIRPDSFPMPAPAQVAAPSIPAIPDVPDVQPQPRGRASFECAGARSGAEQMVCSDPQLADADRAMQRAYRRAMRSGADPQQLRDEQRDWLGIREQAARRSPRAVASIYDQRIDELNRIADDGDY